MTKLKEFLSKEVLPQVPKAFKSLIVIWILALILVGFSSRYYYYVGLAEGFENRGKTFEGG
jgi:hypothetical protein